MTVYFKNGKWHFSNGKGVRYSDPDKINLKLKVLDGYKNATITVKDQIEKAFA